MDDTIIVQEIAQALGETKTETVKAVVNVIGTERAMDYLRQALEVDAQGGMQTSDGIRRRTPGGVFFKIVKDSVSKEERRAIFPQRQGKKKKKGSAPAAKVKAAPMSWDEAKQLIAQAIKTIGEARAVKVTLIGRPLKVIQQKDCVVISLKGREPKSLPTGLPPVPEGSAITWAVFIVNKQWAKVKASIEANENDALIIEGYPIVGKGGIAAVMTNSCKSVLMERAQREQKGE